MRSLWVSGLKRLRCAVAGSCMIKHRSEATQNCSQAIIQILDHSIQKKPCIAIPFSSGEAMASESGVEQGGWGIHGPAHGAFGAVPPALDSYGCLWPDRASTDSRGALTFRNESASSPFLLRPAARPRLIKECRS